MGFRQLIAYKSIDPILLLARPKVISAACLILLSSWLFLASAPCPNQAPPGMGGADRIGVGILGLTENQSDIPEDEPLSYTAYMIKSGDVLSRVAEQFNVTLDTIVSVNDIKNARGMRIGQTIKIPSQSGIMYAAKAGETLAELAQKFDIPSDRIIEANGLFSETMLEDKRLFLPNARLSSFALREISGELFRWPARGWISSYFGWRKDPFSGTRTFHNGLDIAANYGSPVAASMEGRVVDSGFSPILGYYVGISHHSGYQTFYGHLSKIGVSTGQYVNLGQYIGNVGSSGYSTGAHLHFSVLKWGRSVNPQIVMH